MTTFSALTPDIGDICRTVLGRTAVTFAPIGTGRNSRVFRVDLLPDASELQTVVIKFYRRDPFDTRDRLGVEFGGLRFLWQNGVRRIAQPIGADRERYCGVYAFIEGAALEAVAAPDIDDAVAFLASLKPLRGRPGSEGLPAASEAEFSIATIANAIDRRLERLRASPSDGDGVLLHEWIHEVLEPLRHDVHAWCRHEAARSGVPFDVELEPPQRILSPSDFGFHNGIREPGGGLSFVDFEYFGWDDPAKTAADFVLHPGMALDPQSGQQFMHAFLTAFADIAGLWDRTRIVYPLFGMKWCLIVLNDFLPGRATTVPAGELSAVRRAQLAKADALAARIKREYQSNPYIL